jgi:uncharacterized Ntn-hydrolase superfamily protein
MAAANRHHPSGDPTRPAATRSDAMQPPTVRRLHRRHGLTTFSLVGRCPRTGQLGVVVTTADVAAGRMVAWARSGVGAVAMQSWPNLYGAIDTLDELGAGAGAESALRTVIDADPGREVRQVGVVDAQGQSASWSGNECTTWYGDTTGPGYAAQGNMLLGPETVSEMVRVFESTPDEELVERLVSALEAGQAAGGDKRGRQCAALLVVSDQEYPLWDLRVDEHPNPVAELRRIYTIAREQLLPFVEGLPTRENPLGDLSDSFIAMNMLPPPQRPGGGGSGPPVTS